MMPTACVRATPADAQRLVAPTHSSSATTAAAMLPDARERRGEGRVATSFPRVHSDSVLCDLCRLERIAHVRRGHWALSNADAGGVEDRIRHGRADRRRRWLTGAGQRPALIERRGVAL